MWEFMLNKGPWGVIVAAVVACIYLAAKDPESWGDQKPPRHRSTPRPERPSKANRSNSRQETTAAVASLEIPAADAVTPVSANEAATVVIPLHELVTADAR